MSFPLKLNGWTVALAALLITGLSFPAVFLHPNTTLFSYGGDGIKNYFTALYYLKYNSGAHFNGMNYPFGEHLSFADAQPGLVIPLKWLSKIVPSISNYFIALLNLSVLAGLVLGSVSIYWLLRKLKASPAFAVAGALLIAFLSPQLFRFESHYGLSYIFYFPLGWYLFLLAEEKQKWMMALFASLVIAWTGLLHFYLAAGTCLFLFAYALLSTIARLKKDSKKLLLLRWSIPAGSMALLQLFIRLSDTVKDRPTRPWGFFSALASVKSVFLPNSTDFLGKYIFGSEGVAEGNGYIGLAAVLFLLSWFFIIIRRMIVRKWQLIFAPFQQKELLFLLSSIGILLFSMGVPFVWGPESWVDKLGFIKQFRGLGRFAWIFYYTITVFTVLYFSRQAEQFKNSKTKFAFTAVLLLFTAIWTTECIGRIKTMRELDEKAAFNYQQFTNGNFQTFLSAQGVSTSKYQAVLSLPYHHIGSEKFALDQWPSPYYGMKLSLETGVPSLNVMLSRTSLSQSCALMQFTGDTLLQKTLLKELNPDQPLLVITYGGELSPSEQTIINKARLLCSFETFRFYEVSISAFRTNDNTVKSIFAEREKTLHHYSTYFSTDPASHAITKYFDTTHTIVALSLQDHSKQKRCYLLDSILYGYKKDDTINISLWIKIEPLKDALPVVLYKELNYGRELEYTDIAARFSRNVYEDKILMSKDFVLKGKNSRILLWLDQGVIFSNLLIRRKNEQVYIPVKEGGFYMNNLPVGINQ